MKGEIMLCRCCDKPVEGTAFCRTCYDRANYQPDSGEINTELLVVCEALSATEDCRVATEREDAIVTAVRMARAAIAKTEGQKPQPNNGELLEACENDGCEACFGLPGESKDFPAKLRELSDGLEALEHGEDPGHSWHLWAMLLRTKADALSAAIAKATPAAGD